MLNYSNTCATIYSIVFEHNDTNTSVLLCVYAMHKYINSLFMVNASVNERRNINSKKVNTTNMITITPSPHHRHDHQVSTTRPPIIATSSWVFMTSNFDIKSESESELDSSRRLQGSSLVKAILSQRWANNSGDSPITLCTCRWDGEVRFSWSILPMSGHTAI